MLRTPLLVVWLLICSLLITCIGALAEEPLNAVVASVNGKAITLVDIQKKAKMASKPKLSDCSAKPELRQLLDQMILEQLIEEEAKDRQLSVNASDIDGYINDIARQNGLSVDEFKKALRGEKIQFDEYKTRVRGEILRSKIAGVLFREGTSISDEEIEAYLKEHGDLNRSGEKVKLRQLVVSKEGKSSEEIAKIGEEIEADIQDGDDFEDIVKKFSDSPDKKDGGLLGVMAISDLSPAVQDTILLLKAGETSEKVENDSQIYFFHVEERLSGDTTETVKEDVRRMLENQKMQEKLNKYFTLDIYKKHSIEKKV